MEIIQRIHFQAGNGNKASYSILLLKTYRNLFFQQLDTSEIE